MYRIHPAVRPTSPLSDGFGREITYLRLSVTDRSNLRTLSGLACEVRRLPKAEVLSLEEMERLCDAFIHLGVQKIRLAGGEPLLRGGIMGFIERLGARLAGGRLQEVALTTNGTLLAQHARALADAGVRRVNVTLDTLDESNFRRITEHDRLGEVLDGIEAARAAGLLVRVNFTALAGINDGEFDHLIRWCGERGCDLALIEVMPPDIGSDYYLPLDVVNWHLSSRWTLIPCPNPSAGPCRYWMVAETGCRLGFIAPISHPFCVCCNRIEVNCSGCLSTCVSRRGRVDLKAALRSSESDDALYAAITAGVATKLGSHRFAVGGLAGGVSTTHPQSR